MNTPSEVDTDLHELVEANRKLTQSPELYEQVVGCLCVSGMLVKRLALLSDREIAKLMWDYLWNELTLFSPQMAILEEAVQRPSRPVEKDTHEDYVAAVARNHERNNL